MSRPAIPVARPRLPPAAAIAPYLAETDANARYADFGVLSDRFQARLASHAGLRPANVTLVANATAGLTLALLAAGAKPGRRCLLPSWTFAASAGAVRAAGLIPHFVDVLPSTWAPEPMLVERLARQRDVGAIVIVAPFGAPIDLAIWDDVARRSGIPVIIDAAAAFDTLRHDGPMPIGDSPVIVSLHATKVFGIGEGGAVFCRDSDFVARVRAHSQSGVAGTRLPQTHGAEAKLSEYSAAVGLAGFDTWEETRRRWERVTCDYAALLPPGLAPGPSFGRSWLASTFTVLWPVDRPALAEALAAQGIASLAWWGAGCHALPAYAACASQPLPVTRLLARRAVGLPFFQDLTEDEIARICAVAEHLLEQDRVP